MKTIFAALTGLLVAACVPKPAKSYSTDEISALESLPELMRIQADKADPLFGKSEFSDADWAAAADAGTTIQATAARVGDKFASAYDQGFVDFAAKVEQHAKTLEAAAQSKDAAAASGALEALKNACSGCHGVYR